MIFGIILKEGKRGVWRLQNLVFERSGIIVTDELARIAFAQLTSGKKRSNKLQDGLEKIKRLDDIAKLFGDGDGLSQTSRAQKPPSPIADVGPDQGLQGSRCKYLPSPITR